jgi:uncharacterized protein
MRRWNRFLLACVLCVACSSSEPAPDSPTQADRTAIVNAACPTVTKPFFYTLTKDGKTSYLLGTRHASVGLAKFPQAVRDAFDGASTLVLESDLDTPLPPRTKTVEQELGADDFAKFRKLVGKQIADAVNANGIGSAVGAIILLYDDLDQQLDRELLRGAQKTKRDIVFLEDAKESEEIGEQVLTTGQVRNALKIVRSRKLLENTLRHDLELYCAGEWESSMLNSLGEPLVAGRNAKWIDRLEKLTTERDHVFIAVGNAHVIGMTGLIDMFQKRGYTLARNP